MKFEVVLAPQAVEDYHTFARAMQATLKTAIATHLVHQPGRVSKSRIKRLRGLRQPQFRLRVGDARVFYDINQEQRRVEVLRMLPKNRVAAYLQAEAFPDENDAADESEG